MTCRWLKKKKNFLGKIKQKVFFLNLYDGNVINQFARGQDHLGNMQMIDFL